MDAAKRILREREFHNIRFADDSEREDRVGRFYAAIANCFDWYRTRVFAAATQRSVVECGCGAGDFALDLAGAARQVIGIDISDVAIDQAQRAAQRRGVINATFLVDNAEAMQARDHSVDVVAGSGIVHHLDIPQAMQEFRRVLRPGGVAVFAEPLGHNALLNWYRGRTPELRTPDEHPLTVRDLRAMAQGFESAHIAYFGLISPALGLLWRTTDPQRALTKFVWRLDSLLCRIPLLRRYAWYCVVELRV